MSITRRIHNLLHPKRGCIVMLHQVKEGTKNYELRTKNSLMITPAALEDLITSYREKGWRFVSMDDIVEMFHVSSFRPHSPILNSQFSIFLPALQALSTAERKSNTAKNSQESRFVSLTFDDGYLDTYTTAYPLLKRLRVPFCVYMTRDFYRGVAKPQWDSEVKMMNVEQMVEMSHDPLCTIGAHTCTHPRLTTLSVENQRREIKECKEDLGQLLGRETKHLAYPHGDYNQTTVEIATELGFKTAVTTSGRFVRDDSRLMELDRLVTF